MIPSVWRTFSADARRFLRGALLLELGHAFLWVLQNLYVRAVGHGEAEIGLVLMASAAGVVLATFPSASLYERLGPRRSLTLASVVFAIAAMGLACSASLAWLMLFSMLQGASFVLHKVVAAPFIVTASGPGERAHLFGAEFATHTLSSAFGLVVAGVIASLLGGLFDEVGALRATLVLGALLSLSAGLAYRRISDAVAAPDAGAPRERRRMFSALAPRHWHLWWKLALPHFTVGLGAGLTIPFFNLYFTDRFGLATDRLGLVMGASQLTMTLAVLGLPRLVARIGLLPATVLTEGLSLPFFVLLAFTTNLELAITASILRTAFMNLSHPLWRHFIMEVTPAHWRAAVNGVTALAWSLGWALTNSWGGHLIEASAGWITPDADGYTLPMLATASLYVLAILIELFFFWNARQLGRLQPAAPAVSA